MEQHLLSQVDSLFKTWDHDDTPGCVVGLISDGELIYTRGYGMANLEYSIPITPDTIFYLASTSKQFTAASILLLAQKGLLSLEDDIRKYFPEMPVYDRPVCIHHLLHHTSGLREHGTLSWLAGLCPLEYRTADALALICRQQGINYPAGEMYLYNNAGYVLQAGIVERVSGQTLPVFVRQNIFEPLGMYNSIFSVDCTRLVPKRAASYEAAPDGAYRQFLMTNNVTGSAGMMTTVADLFAWDQNFYNPKLGGEDFVRQMETRGKLHNGEKINYSAGLMHGEVCGQRVIYHTGTEFGYRSIMMRFPEKKFTIICLANLASFSSFAIAEQVAEIFFGGQAHLPEQNPKPKASFRVEQDLAGFYLDPESGAMIELSLQDGKLFADALGVVVPLSVTAYEKSKENETLKLEYNSTLLSNPLMLEMHRKHPQAQWSMHAALGDCRLPVLVQSPPAVLEKSKLDDYCGIYYSPELKTVYEFRAEYGKLVTAHLGGLRGSLKPGPAGFFTLDGLTLHFIRGEDQRVSRFRLWDLSARGIVFIRSNQYEIS